MVDQRRRTVLKALGGAGALVLGGAGTATARNGRRKGASADPTLVEFALAANDSGPYAGAFDTLIAALQYTGLEETLNRDTDQYTVFGPTDAAFAELGIDETNVDQALTVAEATSILTYHVTEGRRYSESVLGAPRFETVNGAFVTQEGGVLNDGQASIIATDFEASNGVFHAIDGVLLP